MSLRRSFLLGLTAFALMPFTSFAAGLPDLAAKKVVVVTENAYPPLQFIDPKSGKAIGWVLREASKRDPEWIAAWTAGHLREISGVTFREAVRRLPVERDRSQAAHQDQTIPDTPTR